MGTEARVEEEDIRYLVGMNVRRLRLLQNLSQLDLAVNADLTHNFINDLENGKKGVSCRSLAKLSTALQAEPFQFFLPRDESGGGMSIYVRDFNDNLQKMVGELTRQYLPDPSAGPGQNGGAGDRNTPLPKGTTPEK